MDAVNMTPKMYVTNAKTGQVVAKSTSTVSFSDVLSGTCSSKGVHSDEKQSKQEILENIMKMLQDGSSSDEIAEALKDLSSEDTATVLDVINQLIKVISGEIKPQHSDSKLQTLVQKLLTKSEDEDNTKQISGEIASLIMTAIVQPEDTTTADINQNTEIPLVAVSQKMPMQNTVTEESTGKVMQMLETFKDALALKNSENSTVDMTVIKNDFVKPEIKAVDSELKTDAMPTEETVKTEKNSELDELLAFSQQTAQSVTTQPQQEIKAMPIERQVTAQIEKLITAENIDTTKELTIMLKPAELGQITVKLIKTDDAMSISIIAESAVTGKLLSDKLPTLISTLQDINPEVKDVSIVTPNQNASSFLDSFNTSHSGQNSHSNSQQQSFSFTDEGTQKEDTVQQKQFIREGQLWQSA